MGGKGRWLRELTLSHFLLSFLRSWGGEKPGKVGTFFNTADRYLGGVRGHPATMRTAFVKRSQKQNPGALRRAPGTFSPGLYNTAPTFLPRISFLLHDLFAIAAFLTFTLFPFRTFFVLRVVDNPSHVDCRSSKQMLFSTTKNKKKTDAFINAFCVRCSSSLLYTFSMTGPGAVRLVILHFGV